MNRPKITGRALAYYLMVAVIVGSIVYTKADTGRQVSASESRQNDRNTKQLACLSGAFEDFLTGNQKLREASAKRDDALVGSKKALRELIRLTVIERTGYTEAVRQAADQYLVQTQNFIDASDELTQARREYRLPKFEDRCGVAPPGFRGAWWADMQPPYQYPAGLSIEAP